MTAVVPFPNATSRARYGAPERVQLMDILDRINAKLDAQEAAGQPCPPRLADVVQHPRAALSATPPRRPTMTLGDRMRTGANRIHCESARLGLAAEHPAPHRVAAPTVPSGCPAEGEMQKPKGQRGKRPIETSPALLDAMADLIVAEEIKRWTAATAVANTPAAEKWRREMNIGGGKASLTARLDRSFKPKADELKASAVQRAKARQEQQAQRDRVRDLHRQAIDPSTDAKTRARLEAEIAEILVPPRLKAATEAAAAIWRESAVRLAVADALKASEDVMATVRNSDAWRQSEALLRQAQEAAAAADEAIKRVKPNVAIDLHKNEPQLQRKKPNSSE